MFKTSQASHVGSIFTAPNGRSTHSGELPKTVSTNRNRRVYQAPGAIRTPIFQLIDREALVEETVVPTASILLSF